jgi:hypothetical protein
LVIVTASVRLGALSCILADGAAKLVATESVNSAVALASNIVLRFISTLLQFLRTMQIGGVQEPGQAYRASPA